MKAPKYNYPKIKLTTEYEYVKVERKVDTTASTTGETGYTWTEITTNVKASIHPLSNANKANFTQLSQGTNWSNYRLMICEYDVDIQVRDRITQWDNDIWYVQDLQPYPQTHKEYLICMTEETL
jgi:hypothetical protein